MLIKIIAKVLKGFKIKVAHKPIGTIANILKKPKVKINDEAHKRIIYKSNAKISEVFYDGQTSRTLKTRVKEHTKAIATLDRKSLLAQLHMLHQHEIDLEEVDIIDRSTKWKQRLILEVRHSVREVNSMKTLLSQTYTKTLKNFRNIQNLSHYYIHYHIRCIFHFSFYSYNILDAVFINILKLKKFVATTKRPVISNF